MDVDPPQRRSSPPDIPGASREAQFDLSSATLALLKQLGLVPHQTGIVDHSETVQRLEYLSQDVWVPLVSNQDVQVLLSAVAPNSLPESLRDNNPLVTPSQPTRDDRRVLLDTVAKMALEPSLTIIILSLFDQVSSHLFGRWLDMLGYHAQHDQDEWEAVSDSLKSDGDARRGQLQAVERIYAAMIRALPVFDNVFPFLTALLRHPLLSTPPLATHDAPANVAAGSLLALYSLLHMMPHLPTSEHTATSSRLPWSLPPTIETTLKRHPHRGLRLLAWHVIRRWYAMYGADGARLRDIWVWPTRQQELIGASSNGQVAPMPDYPVEAYREFQERFGEFDGVRDEEDILAGFDERIKSQSRFVEGGLEVLVRRRAVDPWILPAMHEARTTDDKVIKTQLSASSSTTTEEGTRGRLGSMDAAELSPCVADIEGVLLFREGFIPSTRTVASTLTSTSANEVSSQATSLPSPELFVRTPTVSTLLRKLALHVQTRMPVLVTAPPSSGKLSSITHLWHTLHASPFSNGPTAQARQRGLVVINLADRSLDSKSLLGSLSSAPTSSTATAGTFTFVEGPLTRAMRQGRWVVLTAIDQASVEILTVVKVVVERMKTAASSDTVVGGAWGGGADESGLGVGVRVGGGGDGGRWVKAGKGFMLFATRSTDAQNEASFFASHFWSEVHMPSLDRTEVEMIVGGRYPRLQEAGLSAVLIDAWEKVRAIDAKDSVHAGTSRPAGVRDLIRWARRVEGLVPRDVRINSILSNPTLQEEIFVESRDVFLGSMPVPASAVFSGEQQSRDKYSITARTLAEVLSLSEERAEYILRRRVPDFLQPELDDEQDGSASPSSASSSSDRRLQIGRVSLPFKPARTTHQTSRTFAYTNPSLIVLEKLGVCVRLSEPVLMVGETGTGKTTAVQHLADKMGKSLTALNLSNQTEAGDLIGGFRPIDEAEEARRTAAELVNKFIDIFGQTFNTQRNAEYVSHVRKAFDKKRWSRLVGLWREAARMAEARIGALSAAATSSENLDAPRKRRKIEAKAIENLPAMWSEFVTLVGDFDIRHVQQAGKSKFVFSFVEGPLAKAIRNGDWVLLDEVNLASAETLESLSTLLQAPDSSLVLSEQGDLEPIPRHPEFRLFACMNPATDVGKRDLPSGLRAKFSEIWVPPPDEDRDALVKIIEGYIGRHVTNDLPVVGNVADLYTDIKGLALSAQLSDGANQAPHFSMRTLARALTFAAEFAEPFGSLRRSLYEGFLMSFTMLLDPKSQEVVAALITRHIIEPARNARSLMKQRVKRIGSSPAIFIEPYWLETGEMEAMEPKDYILTASVQRKVADLARAVMTRKVPVLIQGPTSAGKTSVVEYLAKRTGHRFVRINNHEHTDIQEYIGTYVSDPDTGKLLFQEGVLVRALRRGDWIVLDELNLAPTDVLEALNRLLDDNRELVIPETGEVVRPHPHFMLFATQNPPGLYGGRKVLSRAFRNRFLEMHFGDVPQNELETILCERCAIAPSYAKKTVGVFLELQRRRQAGRVFEQKQAFATLRDLFRWGGRGSVGYQQLAEDGYMLLAERARRADDKLVVKEVIESEMRVKIDEATLYDFDRLAKLGLPDPREASHDLVWTGAMRRLYFLIAAALHRDEPVLLVGETGAGKTSVCQALASAVGKRLHIVGCHQNTETADLLGGQRPLRNRAALQSGLRQKAVTLLPSIEQSEDEDFDALIVRVGHELKQAGEQVKAELQSLLDAMNKSTALFEWHDGPLVQAMRDADLILLDEISLADDSVLERLNSVLEPSRTLVLAEKGGRDLDDIRIIGQPGFKFLATMNPGGDFGKKELSPALRNRFTEIWVPAVDDLDDLALIIKSRWAPASIPELENFGPRMLDFAKWLGVAIGTPDVLGVGLRDILGWIDFLSNASERLKEMAQGSDDNEMDNQISARYVMSPQSDAVISHETDFKVPSRVYLTLPDAFCQGALMSVVDGLGALPATSGLSKEGLQQLRRSCWRYLETLVPTTIAPEALPLDVSDEGSQFAVGPYGISKGAIPSASVEFTLLAPTTKLNAMRLLRALQLKKPVLLEGSPGVGKTSLVTALAAATGHHLVRINLSDQTDLMDLLGSDLPVEGGKTGEFAWKDAPFLAAMQNGDWVLLDEMNLASQSILEGLNSCLDHRGAVFIPELDRTFTRHADFRIFAAQNPLGQGGGRKGLPRSFLDRFSIVHMEELDARDLEAIAAALYPDMDAVVVEKMVAFNTEVHRQTMDSRKFGLEGSPWEFNLRDVLRWLSLIQASTGLDVHHGQAVEYFGLLYLQRFRTLKDRQHVARLFSEHFAQEVDPLQQPWSTVTSDHAQIGHSLVSRSGSGFGDRLTTMQSISKASLQPLEALIKTLDMGWLAILTGPRNCGKTTFARQVAALSGRRLHEFSMSAEVDTLELLGSFEQAEKTREFDRIIIDAIRIVNSRLAVSMLSSQEPALAGHSAIKVLTHCRNELNLNDVDVKSVAQSVQSALESINDSSPATSTLIERLQRAVDAPPASARFEWIDGPLVQALKHGDWLLIEDANLCSPSVLDRLNSLFESGGRLQLAERGPVDGEIQIITPHPDFRMIMTLDPRNGELSRAMRNRGIEIAILDNQGSRQPTKPFPLGSDSFVDPVMASLAPTLAPLYASTNQDSATLHLVSALPRRQHGFVVRLARSVSAFLPSAEVALRELTSHALTNQIVSHSRMQGKHIAVAAGIMDAQPLDLSLRPKIIDTALASHASAALDSLATLLLALFTQPTSLRSTLAKSVKTLTIWEKSLLSAHGKPRQGDDDDPAMLALYPLAHSLVDFVGRLLTNALTETDGGNQDVAIRVAVNIQRLIEELRQSSAGQEMDYSSVQHIIKWVSDYIENLPSSSAGLADGVMSRLKPLQTSLTLKSGKAMSNIWKTVLRPRSTSEAFNEAFATMLVKAHESDCTQWDQATRDLFLEIVVSLSLPQVFQTPAEEAEAIEVVTSLAKRIPTSEERPEFASARAFEAAGYIVTELAALHHTLTGDAPVAQTAFAHVARQTSVVPLTDAAHCIQTNLQPGDVISSKAPFDFVAILTWSEHLALGVDPSLASPADITKPILTRAIVDLRNDTSATLRSLTSSRLALARMAKIQLGAATADVEPRLMALQNILAGAIALIVRAAEGNEEIRARLKSAPAAQVIHLLVTDLSICSPVLQESVGRYLTSSLSGLTGASASLSHIAHGYVAFARTLWHLYLPDLPIDPAVGFRARSNFLGHQMASLQGLFDAVQVAERALTGNERNLKLDRLASELSTLQQEHDTSGSAPVDRQGNPAQLAGLFQELRAFQNQVIADQQMDALLTAASQGAPSPDVLNREATLQRSIDTLLRRLKAAFADMDDVLNPIRLSLCSLKIGMALLVHGQVKQSATKANRTFWNFASRLISFPRSQHAVQLETCELPLSLKLNEAVLPASTATLVQLASATDRLSSYGGNDRDQLLRTKQLYDRLHHLWTTDRKHEEQAAREAESIYKSKTDVQEIKSDEELEAAEFAELFPTYDDVLAENDDSTTKVNGVNNVKPSRLMLSADQGIVARLHLALFGSSDNDVKAKSASQWRDIRNSVISTLLSKWFNVLGDDFDRSGTAWRVESLVQLNKANQQSSDSGQIAGDFYTEANVAETSRAMPVLQEFARRLLDLVNAWPDQMVLQTLLDRCNAILAFAASSPIAKVLTALEQLLTQTEDWQTYASREHSVASNRTSIIDLIVHWRRLELACWSKLLDGVQNRFADAIAEWWFRFYESMIQGALENRTKEEEEIYLRELVALLDSFLMGTLMHNVVSFYSQYSSAVNKFLTTERTRIDKEVKSVIKLASWKDVNVYALRQSAVKSHHMLYKNVRKLRTVLQQPASDFFRAAELDKAVGFRHQLGELDLSFATASALPSLESFPSQVVVGQHVIQLETTLKRLCKLVAGDIDPLLSRDEAAVLEDLSTQIITTAKALREESTDGEDEGKEQRVKNLATRKRRAWIELLRELKRLGLSPSPAPDVVKRMADPAFIYTRPSFATIASIESDALSNTVQDQLRRVDEYHFKLVSDLPALRKCPVEHSDDISTREIQRAIGSIESNLSFAMQHRTSLSEALAAQTQLRIFVERFASLASDQFQLSARSTIAMVHSNVASALFVVEETIVKLQDYRSLAGSDAVDCSSLETIMTAARSDFVDVHTRLTTFGDALASFEPTLATAIEHEIVVMALNRINSFKQSLLESTFPDAIAYLAMPLREWANQFEVSSVLLSKDAATSSSSDVASLVTAHAELIDSVLVIAQDLKKSLNPTSSQLSNQDESQVCVDNEEIADHAIKTAARTLQDVLGIFRLPQLLQRVSSFAEQSHAVLNAVDVTTRQHVHALIDRVTPFVKLVVEQAGRHLHSFLAWHKASLKLSHVLVSIVLELSSSGFCKPTDSSGQGDEQAADGKTSDGTGMADGQGAKNVSNEIEDESQIEGLQNDVQQEQGDKNEQQEEEDDDDAIEMNADFEGELEDRGNGEQDDKDSDEDEDDEKDQDDEPEEQVADVDPLDPSTVDEKFWGDEDDDKQDPKDGSSNEQVNQETKQSGEAEMTAKDEEGGPPKPRGDEAKEEASAEEQKDANEQTAMDDEVGEDDNKDQEQVEDGEAEDNEQQQEDGEVQDDHVDRVDNQMPEADNLDLPDDMNFDGDEKKDEGEADDDFGDMDSLANEGDDESDDDNRRDELDEMGDQRDEETDDALHPDEDPSLPADKPEDGPDENAATDQSLGGVQEGETGGEGTADAQSTQADSKAQDEETQRSGQRGQDLKPTDTSENQKDADAEAQDVDMDEQADDETAPQAPSAAGTGPVKERGDSSADGDQAQPDNTAPQQQRSLGDSLRQWQRRLESIPDLEPDQDQEVQNAADTSESKQPQEGDVGFVQEGEEREEDEQALGPAGEEQVQALENLRLGEEELPQTFEPDAMDQDTTAPSVAQPQTTTVNISGSNLAEADAKAVPATDARDESLRDATADDDDIVDLQREDDHLTSAPIAHVIDDDMNETVEQAMLQWRSGEDENLNADNVWRMYETLTRDLSFALTEQLRLILEPTLATRLKGDYRSGKRLNLKKIIPYIASEFTKDKIWLRRTRPSQREYQVMIAIDDSKSMADSHSVHLAFQSLALIARSLTRLEVGGVSISKFGDTMDVLHDFDQGPVGEDVGAKLIERFTFSQRTTDVRLLVEQSLAHLARARDAARSGKSSLAASDLWQLQIIISDGMCQDHDKLRALLRQAAEQKVMFVFVVIDSLHRRAETTQQDGAEADNSILAMKAVSYSKGADGRLELKMKRYIDDFPFDMFVVLRDVDALPDVLSATLRQFFEKVSSDR
ncbi:AAA ATPase midasin [Microbotryomycetes sp. JL221]|nr:AAA ATPase midasin [Microbotryomycetes sp. JL221]